MKTPVQSPFLIKLQATTSVYSMISETEDLT